MKSASNAVTVKYLWSIILSPARTRNFIVLIAMTTISLHDVMDAVVYLGQE